MSFDTNMENEEYLEIKGTIEKIVFRNEENGYSVLEVDCSNALITVVGVLPFVSEGESIKAVGFFKNHHSFGKQFQVEAYERFMPTDIQAIYKYLSSGVIKGIGKATAKRIVDAFGEDTFKVIEQSPGKLAKIRGITREKAEKISQEYKSISGLKEIIVYFFKFSITTPESIRIWKKFGIEAISEIKKNPYIICADDINIVFDKAEDIAQSLSIPVENPERIQYGILHVIKHNARNGHTCIPQDKLIPLCSHYLSVEGELVAESLEEMCKSGRLASFEIDERVFIALRDMYENESFCATRLALMRSFPPKTIEDVDKKIEQIEKKHGIKYAEKQKKAVKYASEKGLLIMTGGPGTGKTTTIKAIIEVLTKNKEKVRIAAPTGRAAKRMSEITGREAKTIHRLLGAEFDKNGKCVFTKHEKNLLKCDALILDELSMVDISVFSSLLKALPLKCRLIMIGDSDQLPSVGPGNVLKDMIASGILPVVELDEIFRQSKKSLIVTNAHKIVCGEYPDLNLRTSDFFFLDKLNAQEIMATVSDLYINRLPKSYGFNPLDDIQILCPGRKGILGSIEINKFVQNIINPKTATKPGISKNGFELRVGDKVMQIKNNYDIEWEDDNGKMGEGVFNGDIGVVEGINKKTQQMRVRFDDRFVLYENEDIDELELAYATTVHKSQGSEFDAVIIPMYKGARQLYYRNLLYTAVTRAKKILVMVGVKNVVKLMVDNNRKTKRYTALESFLKEGIDN